jgi:hypothetical protein
MLGDTRSTNLLLGSNTATGAMTLAAWTPAANVAHTGVLTLDTGGAITQTGVLNLATDTAGLLVRSGAGTGTVTLTQANVLTNIAASMASGAGLVSITDAANDSLTVASLTDSIGTVAGITSPGGLTLANSGTGVININQGINTSGNNGTITITSGGASGTGISQAASTTVNAGTGAINYIVPIASGQITLNASSLVLSGNATGSAGDIVFSSDKMSLNSTAQIGGTGAGAGLANYVILTVGEGNGTNLISLGNNATGMLQLTQAALNTVFSQNVRIGGGPVYGPGAANLSGVLPDGIVIGTLNSFSNTFAGCVYTLFLW